MVQLITDAAKHDTLDDRRELWHLLHRLTPADRFRFLGWCCKCVYLPNTTVHPTPSWVRMARRMRDATAGDDRQDNALTTEIYADMFALGLQYHLSFAQVAPVLEALVKRGWGYVPEPSVSAFCRSR